IPVQSTPTVVSNSADSKIELLPEASIVYAPDGIGYKEEIAPGKYLMHLEGSPYEMGYQTGYLGPTSVSRLATQDWYREVVTGLLDGPEFILTWILGDIMDYNRLHDVVGSVVDDATLQQLSAQSGDDFDTLLNKLLALCEILVAVNSQYVPQDFLDEMQGVADGCTDAGYSITYEDVLLLNLGMDALLALAYPVVEPWLFWIDLFSFLSCSGYVATDDATTNGQTIMAHHWQFTDYILHEEMMIMEYYPDSGNDFLATSCPGLVGGTAFMNDQGIAISQDMVPACDCDPAQYGMGTLLTCRYIAQFTSQLTDAINFVKNSIHGCSWLYTIGDGRNGETGGVILELSDSHFKERGLNYKPPWYAFWYNQIEKKDDLVSCTNHYLYYDMRGLADSTSVDDSKDRYNWLTNELLDEYGDIDLEVGAEIIDYLHPPNYNYYSDPNGAVGASITCWDLTNLQLKALYGHYNDDWVYASL
ncbi:MAG: C45 family autoproteolytic acyltransferase/hydrolase, partial [Candidatus Hermodarchaeota archaeon]